MVAVIHNKLVRDNIPDIIRQNGAECETKTVTGAEYKEALRQKLQEEVNEFLKAENAEELADILEVVHALSVAIGSNPIQVEEICAEKYCERGGFEGGAFLLCTRDESVLPRE